MTDFNKAQPSLSQEAETEMTHPSSPSEAVQPKEKTRVLVVAPETRLPIKDGVRLGWRIKVRAGVYDLFWGATTRANLPALITDVRQRESSPIEVLDLGDDASLVRDNKYWSLHG